MHVVVEDTKGLPISPRTRKYHRFTMKIVDSLYLITNEKIQRNLQNKRHITVPSGPLINSRG